MSGLRGRLEAEAEAIERERGATATRSTERIRLFGKLEGVRLALSLLDEGPDEPADAEYLARALEPVMGMYRAQMRADVWREVRAEAAKAARVSADAEDRSASPSALAAQKRETEVLGRVVTAAAAKEKAALDAAEQMRKIAKL